MFRFCPLLPLAVLSAVYALPNAGTYNIVSRVLSPQGQQLAITFGGKNQPVTLQPLSSTNKSQIWNLQVFNTVSMTVASEADPSQQIAPLANPPSILVTSPPDEDVFNIANNTATGFTIGDAEVDPGTVWSAISPVPGGEINWAPSPGSDRLFWVLIPNTN